MGSGSSLDLRQVMRVIVPNYILGPSNCIASSGCRADVEPTRTRGFDGFDGRSIGDGIWVGMELVNQASGKSFEAFSNGRGMVFEAFESKLCNMLSVTQIPRTIFVGKACQPPPGSHEPRVLTECNKKDLCD